MKITRRLLLRCSAALTGSLALMGVSTQGSLLDWLQRLFGSSGAASSGASSAASSAASSQPAASSAPRPSPLRCRSPHRAAQDRQRPDGGRDGQQHLQQCPAERAAAAGPVCRLHPDRIQGGGQHQPAVRCLHQRRRHPRGGSPPLGPGPVFAAADALAGPLLP